MVLPKADLLEDDAGPAIHEGVHDYAWAFIPLALGGPDTLDIVLEHTWRPNDSDIHGGRDVLPARAADNPAGVTVIPVLAYPDLSDLIGWICGALAFALRLRIGSHRAQLIVDAAIVVSSTSPRSISRR